MRAKCLHTLRSGSFSLGAKVGAVAKKVRPKKVKKSYIDRLKGPSRAELGRKAAQEVREAKAAAEAAAAAKAAADEAAAAAAEASEEAEEGGE